MPVADAQTCERIARTHARTFYLAALFLPPAKRRGAFALYAFCRLADDTVDEVQGAGASDASRVKLEGYARALDDAYRGAAEDPVFREVAWTAARFSLPQSPLSELLRGVGRDLDGCRYRSWGELEAYCQGVASSVGEMCTYVFGVGGGGEALQPAVGHARTLGAAMQLTNILRDVGEDARRGRCYLPEEELALHGLSPAQVLDGSAFRRTGPWSDLMRFQIERARALYDQARPGISLLARDAQRCASACAIGYEGILDVIETNQFDSFSRRASLGWPARARVLMHCWLGGAAPPSRSGVTRRAEARAVDERAAEHAAAERAAAERAAAAYPA